MPNVYLNDNDEMTNRFRDTYILDVKNKRPVYVRRFIRGGVEGALLNGNEVTIPKKDLNIDQPTLGVFNVGKGVAYISNLPKRQWKRGLRLDTLRMRTLVAKEVRALEGKRMPDRVDDVALRAIFKAEYPSVADALKQVTDFKRVACAFNNKFFFAIKEGYADVVVGYKNHIAGTVVNGSVKLFKGFEHLKEELSQYIQVEEK